MHAARYVLRRGVPEFGLASGDAIIVIGDHVLLLRKLSHRMDLADLLDAAAPYTEERSLPSTRASHWLEAMAEMG